MSHLDNMKEISELLDGSGKKTLGTTEIHGLLTALVAGPETITPSRWLPYIFRNFRALKTIVKEPWFGRLVELLIESYEDLLFSLRAGTFVPYLGESPEKKERQVAAKQWATGFLYGMHLHGAKWQESKDESLATLTAPLFYLADPEHVGGELDDEDRRKLAEKADDMVELIRYNAPKIFDHWNLGVKPELKKEYFKAQAQE
jgi:uncharacterized protein